MNKKEMKAAIEEKVYECIDKAVDMYDLLEKPNFKFPKITFSLKGRTAGKMIKKARSYELQFNLDMAAINAEFIEQTVPHEVAHLIDCYLHNGFRRGNTGRMIAHDKFFKQLCVFLGGTGSTCHSYKVPESTRKTRTVARPFIYKCSCDEHKITKTIHNRMQAGQRRICVKCKARIVYDRTEV